MAACAKQCLHQLVFHALSLHTHLQILYIFHTLAIQSNASLQTLRQNWCFKTKSTLWSTCRAGYIIQHRLWSKRDKENILGLPAAVGNCCEIAFYLTGDSRRVFELHRQGIELLGPLVIVSLRFHFFSLCSQVLQKCWWPMQFPSLLLRLPGRKLRQWRLLPLLWDRWPLLLTTLSECSTLRCLVFLESF